MEKFEVKNSVNPKDWIIPGTDIFIMPVLVTASSNPNRNYIYNIRHGLFSQKDGGKLTDHIETGKDFCGGFQSMAQVIEYSKNEVEKTSEILKYVKLAMPLQAYEIWKEVNPRGAYNPARFDETSEKRWEKIVAAWDAFSKALVKGIEDGLFTTKYEGIAKMNIGMQ